MVRKHAALFLLSFLIIALLATSLTFGATKPIPRFDERASFPARFAPVYSFSGAEGPAYALPKGADAGALGLVSTNAVGLQLGTTTYDFQHNGSMGHQVEHRGTTNLHFDWMYQQGVVYQVGRGCAYQYYDLVECLMGFGAVKIATSDYGGYVNIDADANGGSVPAAHEGADADSQRPRAYFDFLVAGTPLGTFQSDYPEDVYGWYQNNGVGPTNQNLWPVTDWQTGGPDPILHMVCAETGGALGSAQTASYYRRVGAYGAGSGVWSNQKLIDTIMTINPVVVASRTTGKVAIVWNAPCDFKRDHGAAIEYANQVENDVWYALSTDRGASFMGVTGSIGHGVVTAAIPGANITLYDSMSTWKAYTDLAALITADENLHIVWACLKHDGDSTTYRRQSAIFHWSQDVPYIRTIMKAEWDTGGAGCLEHAWNGDLAKMSISECDGKLYVLYTQYGNAAQPCFDASANKKIMNGDIFLTASNNHGMNWDQPQNLTNSVTPQCADGECDDDMWASMARTGRTDVNGCEGVAPGSKVLDIEYINDKSPGAAVQAESGIWTTNPVMWLVTPCRDVVAEPNYSDNAGTGYGECYSDMPLHVNPDGDTTVTLTIENSGLADNDFSIATSYTNGSGWISAVPSSGTISSGLVNTVDVLLTFTAPAGAPDPSVWVGKITVTHDAAGSPREIPVCMIVASVFTYPESVVLETTCKKIRLWNDGHMVNNSGGYALNFTDDCDTFNVQTTSNIYLYDGSPIVCYIKGEDTVRYMAYSYTFTGEYALRPMGPWTVGDSSFYWKMSCQYSTADTTIGFIADYYSSKDPAKCSFIIQKLRFFNMTQSAINGVLVGEVLDWDIPSDTGSRNGSGFDLPRNLIYQFGGEYDDSTEEHCAQNSNDRFGGVASYPGTTFMNAFTVDNATYVYTTTSPWGGLAPFPPGPMYEKMLNSEGFTTWSSSDPDSLYTDLSTVLTFGQYNLTPGDTFSVVKVLSTSKTGLTYLNAQIDAARAGDLWTQSCCNKAGDANNDNKVNVGDAVYIISYVFRGGPPPPCLAEGNANGDLTPQGGNKINVGDAVYIISYVFRQGPAPICGVAL